MTRIKKQCFFLLLFIPSFGLAQGIDTNLFIRTPQVINYNLNQEEVNYSPVVSVGVGISHKTYFVEMATFLNDEELFGYYSFFGKTLKKRNLVENLNLFTNWFGEVSYAPEQSMNSAAFTYTSGICYFLNYSFDRGSIGIPLCFGLAYHDQSLSLNMRTILNLSINL